MLGRLRTLFSKNVKFSPGSPPPHGVDETFLNELGGSSIFVIGATQSEGIDAKTLTAEQLLAQIREALERDRESQKAGYALFVYAAEGKRRLPFFTSNEYAQLFCGEYSKERGRVYPFIVLQAPGTFIGKIAIGSCDIVVMNDKSPDARVLTEHEIAAARQMWG